MRWMWIDRIIELVPHERLVAIKNVSMAEEHLHDHFAADPPLPGTPPSPGSPPFPAARPALPVMPASLILEGMAQTAGVLVGHAEDFKQKVILAKIGRAELTRDVGPGMTLRYTATIQRMDAMGAATLGTVDLFDHAHAERGYQTIGQIEMMFSHLDNNMGGAGTAGDEFPEHNFVFGEAFMTLLRGMGGDVGKG